MDWMGIIADFIAAYPKLVNGILIGIAVLAVIILFICLAAGSRKKKRMLSDIRDKVTEINSAVAGIGRQRPEVIYIDNRTGDGQNREPALDLPVGAPTQKEAYAEPAGGEAENPQTPPEQKCSAEPSLGREEKREQGAQMNKYFSRDCAVSKNGKAYTEAELIKQIKE